MSSAADSFLTRIRAHQKWLLMVFVCALVGVSQSAYVFFTNESGRALRWSVDLLPLRIAVWEGFSQELGVDGSDDTPRAAIEEALAQWSRSSAIVITDSSTPVSRAGLDGLNLVTVASPNINPDLIGGGLANTLLWSRTGEASDAIIEADVVFNRDQPKAWSTRENPDQLNFFDIALHELGHVLGLQHSIARSSSMFFQGGEFSFGLNQLSWDDIAGINGSFRLPGMDQITGSVSGRVTLEDAPVFGAFVVAVDEAGVFASSAVTLRDGSYRLDLLAPGNYTIYAEPLDSPTTPDQIAGTFFDPVLIETGFQPQFYRDSPVPSVSVAAALLTPSVDIEVRKSQATIDPEYLGALQFGDKGAPLSTSPAGVHQGTSAQIVLTGTGIETLPEQSSLNFLGPYLLSGPATSTIAAGSGYTFKYFPLTVSRDAPRGSYSFFFQAGAEASVVTGGVEVFSPFRFLQTFAHSVFLPGIASSELYLLNTSLQSNASARLIARNTLGSEVGVASSSAVPADASNISLAPAASSFIQTQGGEDFVGSLAAEADQPIGAALLLQTSFGTTGVSASRPLLSFIAPVELKSGGAAANTGVAIANQDIRPALVFLQLQNERGQFLARTILTLEGNSQRAAFVNELFTDYNFRAEPVFRGTLLATANRLVSATVIRTSPSVFTTLPVLENRVASKTFFAHFANAGSLSSELILVNPSSLVRARTVQIQARSGDGSPAAVVLNGTQYPDGALTTQIPPLGSVSFSSSDLPVNGSIQVTSDTPVGGVVLFRSPDFGTAGVGESIPTRQAVLPVDRDESQGVDTGIALVNTEARPVQLRLVVRDEAGQLTGHQANLTLEPYEQLAQFPNGQRLQLGLEARFRGSVWLEADGEVALTALRQSPGVLTTFPAIVPDRFLTTLSDPR